MQLPLDPKVGSNLLHIYWSYPIFRVSVEIPK